MVENEIVVTNNTVALVENFNCCRKISGNVFDVVAHKNVAFEHGIVRREDENTFGTGIAYLVVFKCEFIATKVGCYARAIRYFAVFDGCAHHIFTMFVFGRNFFGVVAVNFEGAVSILGKS